MGSIIAVVTQALIICNLQITVSKSYVTDVHSYHIFCAFVVAHVNLMWTAVTLLIYDYSLTAKFEWVWFLKIGESRT